MSFLLPHRISENGYDHFAECSSGQYILALCINFKQLSVTDDAYNTCTRTKPLHKHYFVKNINPILLSWFSHSCFTSAVSTLSHTVFTIREFSVMALSPSMFRSQICHGF
jgi:hypothetical protein